MKISPAAVLLPAVLAAALTGCGGGTTTTIIQQAPGAAATEAAAPTDPEAARLGVEWTTTHLPAIEAYCEAIRAEGVLNVTQEQKAKRETAWDFLIESVKPGLARKAGNGTVGDMFDEAIKTFDTDCDTPYAEILRNFLRAIGRDGVD